MLRRNMRLRREYLFKKDREALEVAKQDKKERLKRALDAGGMVPTELRKEAGALQHDMELDDARTAVTVESHMDDEYATAGVYDPKVVITSSRDPSSLLKQFLKELRLLFPGSQTINRGSYRTKDLIDACLANQVTDLIIAEEHRGIPDGLIVCHLPHGPTAYFNLSNVVTRHEIAVRETVSEAYPHLIFHNFSSPLGERVTKILKHLFPVPKEDSQRVMSFVNDSDYISFRHHVYRAEGHRPEDIVLKEVGPRFEMRIFKIVLGNIDQPEADAEWELRPYMNTAKKRRLL
eukprot:c33971_g1_i1.p1 GENE.c33971_g1_i1~~c33971_g1_i1.p1  ORF type:complete len:314 (-),score=83.11 c33971_g1_i1:18-890(-)